MVELGRKTKRELSKTVGRQTLAIANTQLWRSKKSNNSVEVSVKLQSLTGMRKRAKNNSGLILYLIIKRKKILDFYPFIYHLSEV